MFWSTAYIPPERKISANATFSRRACTFHVFCVDFICVGHPTQTRFLVEYGLKVYFSRYNHQCRPQRTRLYLFIQLAIHSHHGNLYQSIPCIMLIINSQSSHVISDGERRKRPSKFTIIRDWSLMKRRGSSVDLLSRQAVYPPPRI